MKGIYITNAEKQVIIQNLLRQFSLYNYACLLHSGEAEENVEVLAGFAKSPALFSYAEAEAQSGWKMGYLSYELKNQLESLKSPDTSTYPVKPSAFFCPELVIAIHNNELQLLHQPACTEEEKKELLHSLLAPVNAIDEINTEIIIQQRSSKEKYLRTVRQLKEHIRRGDIYEINYCMEFFSEQAKINPVAVFEKLSDLSAAPFSSLLRMNDTWVIGASPERFLWKKSNTLTTQPIKGTARRHSHFLTDEQLKLSLLNSRKERSENVMIVDVARNDLSRVAERGSVKVNELFGIYSYRQVHQMISTISCRVKEGHGFKSIIEACFPMASMTGAPKISAMRLIDRYEESTRGIYSGSIGYISPDGNFDLNVVIRSIIYQQSLSRLSFSVGSAITYLCDEEQEYEECLLKAKALFQALGAAMPAGN